MQAESHERDFVEVWQGYDAVFADMAKDALESDGISARIRGTENAALIGVGQYAITVSIDVPEEEAPRATELLQALFQDAGISEGDEADDEAENPPMSVERSDSLPRPEGATEDRYRPPRTLESGTKIPSSRSVKTTKGVEKRSRGTALVLGLLFPGFSQIYMRRGYAGLCILLGVCTSLVISTIIHSLLYAGLTILFSIPVDAVAGQLAAIALARGERMAAGRQWLLGLGELVLVQVVAATVSHAVGAL